jgi:hypothetical protein
MYDAETVTWIPTTGTPDIYGEGAPAPGTGRSLLALVAGRTNNENAGPDSPGVIVGKSLYILGTDAEPGPADRILVRGVSYDVVGEAHRWGSSGVEVAIKRTEART